MWDIINKILLSCKDASMLLAEKEYRKLGLLKRVQLKMHESICHSCRQFDAQNDFVDHALDSYYKELVLDSSVHLSEASKTALQEAFDKALESR